MAQINLSIILPTYNESENISLIVNKIQAVLVNETFEIIIVDDNSPDLTWQIGEKLSKQFAEVRCIRRIEERGLSSAIITGFRNAKGATMIAMDADMQHDEKVLPTFIQKFNDKAELVIGTRKADEGRIENWSKWRLFVSWVATLIAKIIMPVTSSDPMSGFFGVSRNYFLDVQSKINPRGFKILLEFLYHLDKRPLAEVGFTFRPRQHGESKLSGTVIWQYLIGLYDLRFGRFIPLRFIKYGIVGLSGVLINEISLLAGINFFDLSKNNALMIAIEISVLTNFAINNYWTFRDYSLKGKAFIYGLFSYNLVCLAGALINYAIAMTLHSNFLLNIFIANLAGIAIATVWNYFINTNFTWKAK